MKLTKTVTTKQKVIKSTTKKVDITLCDICYSEGRETKSNFKCQLCSRDVCHNIIPGVHGTADFSDGGDYPDYYCIYCYELKNSKQFDDMYRKLESDYDENTDRIKKAIKEISLTFTEASDV